MSAVSSVKLKANCNAVSSGSLINQAVVNSSIVEKSSPNSVKTSLNTNNNNIINNGTNLNQYHHQQQQQSSIIFEPANETSFVVVHNNQEQQDCSDVQKVLKQEQELQKQLYSGPNVAPGWLRVNHNNKVIYIR
jgi:hypothetical protein